MIILDLQSFLLELGKAAPYRYGMSYLWRDLRQLEFRKEVLDKYNDNELCVLDNNSIAFLRKEGRSPASIVQFRIKKSDTEIIIVEARDFIFVPPIERKHWLSYQTNQ